MVREPAEERMLDSPGLLKEPGRRDDQDFSAYPCHFSNSRNRITEILEAMRAEPEIEPVGLKGPFSFRNNIQLRVVRLCPAARFFVRRPCICLQLFRGESLDIQYVGRINLKFQALRRALSAHNALTFNEMMSVLSLKSCSGYWAQSF